MSQPSTRLAAGLKQRHITMLSIAGVIGAGLFVGSARAIALAGPAVILAYAMAGLLVVLVMRMLGEMAVASPDTGSFSTYADRAIGPWAGFTIGWLYWWFWVLVIPLEATAAAAILQSWFPGVPLWVFAFGVTASLTATNLFSVKHYGEFEFWFALIKVLAIVVFLAIGAMAVLGLLPGSKVSGAQRLWEYGFMPKGWGAVVAAMLTTMFSFLGTEVVTIAAAETSQPQKNIVRATNSVVWRISLFYLGSVLLVAALVPWNDPLLVAHGAYQRTLEIIGLPHAKGIVDVVVLVSVASCLNSAIYTASRMAFSLARRGDAPAGMMRTNRAGTPVRAVLGSTAVGFLMVIANYLAPEKVLSALMDSTGTIALLVYLVVAVSQLRMRQKMIAAGREPDFRMWAFPWITWGVIVFICGVLVLMMVREDHRMEVISTTVLGVGIVLAGVIWRHVLSASQSHAGTVEARPTLLGS